MRARLELGAEEIAEAADGGRIWAGMAFFGQSSVCELTYGTDPDDGSTDQRFGHKTLRTINMALGDGKLKLEHFSKNIYRVRIAR